MGSEWIEKSLANYQKKAETEMLQRHWAENARAQSPSMFDALKEAVMRDIDEYNHLFSAHEDCRASYQETPDGFRVEAKTGAAKVWRAGGTLIRIEWTNNPDGITLGAINVGADASGNLKFKSDKQADDARGASALILSRILCS